MMNNQSKQPILRFAHPCGVLGSSQWRQGLKSSKHLKDLNLDLFVVNQSSTAFSIAARTPEAATILNARVIDFMRATANVVNKTLDVQKIDLSPSISNTNHRWLYTVPKWVVARPGASKEVWNDWKEATLNADRMQDMHNRLSQDLSTQLLAWTGGCPDLNLVIEDFGRPMILKDAIANGPKPMSVMSRLDVVFSSSHRLEGALYAGLFNVIGFGRVFRSGYQEQTQE